jgi:TonB-dependent receptor
MIVAGYAMFDMPLFPKFRMLGGVRYEFADMDIISYDPTTSKRGELPYEVIEQNNIMPSVNFTYAVTEKTNIRLSGSMTVIRPDFREATSFRYTNITNDEEWKGNPELKQSDVYNADFRYEWFPSAAEIIAFSVFYKYIDSPIENAQQYRAGGDLYASINANYAHNMGAELELKKNLGFIAGAFDDFSFSLNFSYIYSNVNIDDEITFGSDVIQITNNNRPLLGQSPYVINTGLIYENEDAGFTGNILFNITGPTIKSIGTKVTSNLQRGDLYEAPVPRLDVVLKQKVFKKGSIKLSAKNLLDPEVQEKQEYKYAATGQKVTKVVRSYKDGRSFSLSYSHSF